MSQKSTLNPPNNSRPWLEKVYNKKARRTVNLGKQAIDMLKEERCNVTLSRIEEKSKKLDPNGKGIHRNSIKSNPVLYDYYKQNSDSYRRWASSHKEYLSNRKIATINYEHIKVDRDLNTVRRRYSKLSKRELVERLIQTEQTLAEGFQGWLAEQFSTFEDSK